MKKIFALIFCAFFLLNTTPTFAQSLPVNSCICSKMGIVTTDSCQGGSFPICKAVYGNIFDCSCDPVPTSNASNASNASSASNNYLCSDGLSVDTALGCIPIQMDKFITWLLPILFGISGGIAFLLMVYGFILITTSKGDPKAIQGARETITSALTGLIISIFAIFILRLIAVDILKIPGIS